MYIVLSDNSTYDAVMGCSIMILKPEGMSSLEESNDFKFITWNQISATISLEDLVDCYVRNNPYSSFAFAMKQYAEDESVIEDE